MIVNTTIIVTINATTTKNSINAAQKHRRWAA
jgi:hypothetical protein